MSACALVFVPVGLLLALDVPSGRRIDTLAWVLAAPCAPTALHRARHALRELRG